MAASHVRSIRCVGAVVFDHSRRLLLVRRAYEPGSGLWSIPGGKVEGGESDQRALAREVAEETGLRIEVAHHVGSARLPRPDGTVFEIHDYAARVIGGSLRAGSDASDVRWCGEAELAALPLVPRLVETLTEWGCLPPP